MTSSMVALPMLSRDKSPPMRIIPVEMVKISDVTKLKAQEKKTEPTEKQPLKKPAQARKVEMPPAPPKLASSMPLPDMRVKPKKEPEAQKPREMTANRAPNITPRAKPSRFSSGKFSALLDKWEASEPDIIEKLNDKEFGPQKVISALDLQQQTLSIIDAIGKHIFDQKCWNFPAGAKGAEGLRVIIQVRLGPDGKLVGAPVVLDKGRMNLPGQEFFRTAAESALRAVRKCAPYDFLPKAQYDLWRDVDIVFRPEHMLNG